MEVNLRRLLIVQKVNSKNNLHLKNLKTYNIHFIMEPYILKTIIAKSKLNYFYSYFLRLNLLFRNTILKFYKY